MMNQEASVADIALDIVENTRRNVFLTGEAGTGKTTFLRNFLQQTEKRCVVVAPTGVAAINAGGSTIHSMFGLPTRMFLPTMETVDPNVAQNIPMLQSHFHYPKPKLDIFKNLDLLIIDEISMVRCDLFDAIDESLRFSRRSNLPFGGVQLLLIGDLYQLPPVVRNHEKEILFEFYKSEFFFDSHCYPSLNIMQLKLNKVFRQSNKAFIGLLNNIRNATLEDGDFETLQERYQPHFEPDEDGFVTLCSHNSTADAINQGKLQALQGDEFTYFADVSGDFFESQYPIDMKLTLKVGAQVMFVKNDVSGEKKYFNGKIAIVTELTEDQIFVEDPRTGKLIEVERDVWQHLKYQYDSTNDSVSQEEVGSFKHFPLKLAWAITIHKSQGLTLEKVIIDAERSFAPGQVYVALSRAVSLDGLYLKSGITGRNIFLDPKIVEYSEGNLPVQELPEMLEQEKRSFGKEKLMAKFEFDRIRSLTSAWFNKLDRKHGADLPNELLEIYHRHIQINNELERIMSKFRNEIEFIFETLKTEEDLMEELRNRGSKAIRYSAQRMDEDMIIPTLKWIAHYKKKPRSKRWFNALNDLVEITFQKRDQILKIAYNNERLHPDDVSRPVVED
jgi:guanylate kinase